MVLANVCTCKLYQRITIKELVNLVSNAYIIGLFIVG
jgi:hypothetical protein